MACAEPAVFWPQAASAQPNRSATERMSLEYSIDAQDGSRAADVDLALLVFTERGGLAVDPQRDAAHPLAVLAAQRANAAGTEIAEKVDAAQGRPALTAVDRASNDRAVAVRMPVHGDRRGDARDGAGRLETRRPFHRAPTVVLAAAARRRRVIDFLPIVLPNIGEIEIAAVAI